MFELIGSGLADITRLLRFENYSIRKQAALRIPRLHPRERRADLAAIAIANPTTDRGYPWPEFPRWNLNCSGPSPQYPECALPAPQTTESPPPGRVPGQ